MPVNEFATISNVMLPKKASDLLKIASILYTHKLWVNTLNTFVLSASVPKMGFVHYKNNKFHFLGINLPNNKIFVSDINNNFFLINNTSNEITPINNNDADYQKLTNLFYAKLYEFHRFLFHYMSHITGY